MCYHITCKNLTGQTPFRLVYGQEAFIPLEYIVPSLKIVVIIEMTNVGTIEERLSQLVQLEEDSFLADYHQFVEKEWQRAWHECHTNFKQFQIEDLVLLYDNKFLKHPGKFRTHWLGPSVIIHITERGVVQLQKLDGTPFNRLVNGSRLKPYQDSRTSVDWKSEGKNSKKKQIASLLFCRKYRMLSQTICLEQENLCRKNIVGAEWTFIASDSWIIVNLR